MKFAGGLCGAIDTLTQANLSDPLLTSYSACRNRPQAFRQVTLAASRSEEQQDGDQRRERGARAWGLGRRIKLGENHRAAGGRWRQGDGGAAAADLVRRRCRRARPDPRAGDLAGRARRPRLCGRRHWGDAQRESEGARLRRRARSRRRRDGRGRIYPRRAAPTGAEARAGRARADLSARGRLRRCVRPKRDESGARGAGGRPAADLARLHHCQGGATVVEGPTGLVSRG